MTTSKPTTPATGMSDSVHNILVLTETGLNALVAIGDAARGLVSPSSSSAIGDVTSLLHGIIAVVDSIQAGFAGQVTIDKVQADLRELVASIAKNNEIIDSELDARFPKS